MKPNNYRIMDHGVQWPDEFRGCGTATAEYEHSVTGTGDECNDAYQDCLEQMGIDGWDVSALPDAVESGDTVVAYLARNGINPDGEEPFYYVSVSWR